MSYYALTLGGGGSGTVTSVSWTGGIVSIATATTTPAFTIAGTSGGIVYFDSATTWASSGVLTNNALIKGGGAGGAPSSVTTGTGVLTALGVNTGSAGAFVVNGGALGTPSSGDLSNATSLPVATGISGLGTGVATALAINVGSAGAPVVNGGALGTPSSGTVTNLTGTASININGTVGATTANTGTFSSTVHKGATSGTVTIAAPAVAGTQSYTLPSAVPAANGYALTATTGGVMSWSAITASAGGSDTQIQFNNSGALAGNSKLFYNSSTGVFVQGRTTVWNTGAPGGYMQAVTTNNSGPALGIISDFASDSAYAALKINKTANDSTTAQVFAQFIINATASGCGQINANGAGTAAFGSFSDSRLKENIVDLPSQLSNILALRPVEFDYIESEGGGHQIGFVAQEFETVFPDAVGQRIDGMKTLTGWSKTEAILVKTIQELAARIAVLEAK